MEVTPDGARMLATVIPFALLIIAVQVRGLRRRIRVVPKAFAKWTTIVVIVLSLVTLGACFWVANTGASLTGWVAWAAIIVAIALAVQTALTFYEFVSLGIDEELEHVDK
jgi:hypothetical protein